MWVNCQISLNVNLALFVSNQMTEPIIQFLSQVTYSTTVYYPVRYFGVHSTLDGGIEGEANETVMPMGALL